MFGFLKTITEGINKVKDIGETISDGFSRCKEKLSIMKDLVTLKGGFFDNLGKLFGSTNTSLEQVETNVAVDASKKEIANIEDEVQKQQKTEDPNGFFYSEKKDHHKLNEKEAIAKYKSYAIETANKTGIPVAVIMAQFLLESGNGNSKLASYNNFFGLKCFKKSCEQDTKAGKRETSHCIQRTDDKETDRFLKFPTVQEGFEKGYAKLLKEDRYKPLYSPSSSGFEKHVRKKCKDNPYDLEKRLECANIAIANRNNPTKRWVYGLRSVGYATHKDYATLLEAVIKRSNLEALGKPVA